MRIVNHRRFANRVVIPLSLVLIALGSYATLFGNILLYGKPITLLVAWALLVAGFYGIKTSDDLKTIHRRRNR